MTTFGISMVRDEVDIIEHTVRNMLRQVDHVIVADNGSKDGTREKLARMPVELIDDREPGYFQSKKMTDLAERARCQGATWIVPFDADEWWCSPFGRIADVLSAVSRSVAVVEAELFDHVVTGIDGDSPNPVFRIAWRRPAPAPLPKVAVRARPGLEIAQGNHGATYDGREPRRSVGLLEVRHFPYRSPRQMVQKARNGAQAYAAAGEAIPEHQGAHWRQWGRLLEEQGPEAIEAVFRTWYYREDPRRPVCIEGEDQPCLLYDPAPPLPA